MGGSVAAATSTGVTAVVIVDVFKGVFENGLWTYLQHGVIEK